MGMYIQLPGNHDLEYKDREIIGKCSIRVAPTSILIACDGVDCAALMVVARDIVIGTIKTLSPK